MKKDELTKELSLINKTTLFDNPILRHYLKKNKLSDADAVVLGILLELTGQGKIEIRTHYNVLAEYAEMTAMEIYQSVNSLHRYRIIEYKPAGNFVHISFNKIDEKIEEIALAYINAGKIKHLEKDVEFMKKMNYIPAADLFDLITPIIGKIISKKIADALRALVNYINDRLESSMSMRMWRYRFISFKTGIPLGEIILRESLPCVLDEILIIEKKTSLLLAQGSRFEESEADRDLVVAMLSAITDFIRTSFSKKNSELNEISFGDSKIILFESIYFYSAVVIHGAPDLEFSNNIDSLLSSIHLKYRDALKNFKGSMDGLSGINEIINEFINKSNAVSTLIITGVISSPSTGDDINKAVSAFPGIKSIINKTVSADFRTVEKFKAELAQYEKRFTSLQILLIRQELEKIIIQFPSGVTSIGSNQILQTRKIYEILKGYPEIDVDIIAFNDPTGGFDINKKLAEERMAAIKKYLVSSGMDGDRITITDFNPDIISADPRFSGFKDTRGIMIFAKQSDE